MATAPDSAPKCRASKHPSKHPDIPVGNAGLDYVCTALCSQTRAPSFCTTSQLDLSQLRSKGVRLQLIQGAEGCANDDRACLSVRAGIQPAGGLEEPEQVSPPTPQPMSREALHHVLQPVPALEWRDEEPRSRKLPHQHRGQRKTPFPHHTPLTGTQPIPAPWPR